MATPYFADTWYFIALLEPRDTHFRNVDELKRRIPSSALVTHEAVLIELLNYFSEEGAHARKLAASAARQALKTLSVISVDRPLFLAALDRYEARPDKEYSLVDCMSMVLMEQRGIRHVLSNDRHFAQAGFLLVNE